MADYPEDRQVQINDKLYKPFTQAFNSTAGGKPADGIWLADAEPYGPPSESPRRKSMKKVSFEGLNYIGTKEGGLRERLISVPMIVVGDDARVTAADFLDALNILARYTVRLPGGNERQGCKLSDQTGAGHEIAIGSKLCVVLPLIFEQLSDAN